MTQLTPFLLSVLKQPGSVVLPGNLRYVQDLIAAGGRAQRQSSGHLVFYGPENRRFLMTDPDGYPLHECEWVQTVNGHTRLVAARLHLEWGEWVGIRPEGLVNSTSLDLSTRSGWERLTRDDLRIMAARAMNVSIEQIRFFYSDEDLLIGPTGRATIRQRKDALYVLHDGRFEEAKFMSCMSRMRWEKIDYLPVVELFLSLLPGTGSAAFELIRGLYDDQNPSAKIPLHYRGIPVYPSDGAFRLFSQFFSASVPGTQDPLAVFLDPDHSEKVSWLPSADPPLRYFDPTRKLCVTVKQGMVQKATIADDPSGLSYFCPTPPLPAPYGQSVTVKHTGLVLSNGLRSIELPLKSSWGITSQSEPNQVSKNFPTWHQMFPEGAPEIESAQAFSTTLLYPEDQTVIGEKESQPFAMDYFDDLLDEDAALKAHMASARHIMVSACDAGMGSCIRLDLQRRYTILYTMPQFAQKQAQNLWNTLARSYRLDWIDFICFLPYSSHFEICLGKLYDSLFMWVPFADFDNHTILNRTAHHMDKLLFPGGIAFLAGPQRLAEYANRQHFELLYGEYVRTLPTFHLHQAILPQAHVNPDLMVFVWRKNR